MDSGPLNFVFKNAKNITNNTDAILDEYYDGYYDYYYMDHFYEIFDFEVPIYGYVWPILVLLITCCNLFVIGAFLRPRMRTPTSMILVFIAVSDSLTGLVTLPATFHIYPNQNYILTKDWCNVAMISRLYISRAFHTVSVWQTVLLGIHRFLQVSNPTLAQRFCTRNKTLLIIAIIYVLSFVLHMYHAFDIKAEYGFCQWSIELPCGWTCVYIWVSLLLVHVIPCFVLAGLAFFMIRTLANMHDQIGNFQTNAKKRRKHRNLTIVVVLIVAIFLVPELPYGIFFMITLCLRHTGQDILPLRTNRLVHCLYELLLLLSFHLNFWVYSAMIQNFRACVKTILKYATCQPANFERLDGDATSSGDKDLELTGAVTSTAAIDV